MRQLHNAHYQSGEATIRYAFHPRYGESVLVVGRNRHGDDVALTIRQPDGSLAQLPIWMTEDEVAAMTMAKAPRLPLACLRDLRRELDACQSLLRDDPRRAGDEHAAPDTEPSPPRPFRTQGASAGADRGGRPDKAVVSGERTPNRGPRSRRSGGGAR